MKSFAKYIKENYNLDLPHPTVSMEWMHDHGFPMVVECACCGMTMALPCAYVSEDEYVYCGDCAESEDF